MSSKSDFKKQETLKKIRQVLSRPSVSALMFGYLKEKDLNLKDMSVEEWKAIEMDLVSILLGEIYPGEEATEDQLNFTALANSIAFMSKFINALNQNLEKENLSASNESEDNDGPTFEV